MGLTSESTGKRALDEVFSVVRGDGDTVIALAGNPNVGKSTVFNQLTGLKQHTGNWPGKTVTNAQGRCLYHHRSFVLVDIPGTYSLMAHSAEEEVARDFICFGGADAVIVVCDATCLERNMNLVLQALEITGRAVVCVNLMDEARRKRIHIDFKLLEKRLGVPVVPVSARAGEGLDTLLEAAGRAADLENASARRIRYPQAVEQALEQITPLLDNHNGLPARWIALRLLCDDTPLISALRQSGADPLADESVSAVLCQAREGLEAAGVTAEKLGDMIVSSIVLHAEEVCSDAIRFDRVDYNSFDRRLDRLLTSRATGIPAMLLLLAVVFWLTIVGANQPSRLLSQALFGLQPHLTAFFEMWNSPVWLTGALVDGVYRVLAWVVSVMLPPMAIFFPLFTLMEDSGYLPRVAFNLDRGFQKCSACGKQALTMCMGFGCNAAGVTGCRIIDSPRERLIAIITNNFVPCNGRFPTLIAIITMFFIGGAAGIFASLASTLFLTGVIILGVLMTFFVSALLSKTVLKGIPSSFTLELPPYRRPQVGRVIIRSIFDRTLFVLGRAVAVAAPAGLIIWLLANLQMGGVSLLAHCAAFLDPFAQLLGLDGVILMAFILGFPANEIVVPIMIMTYLSTGSIQEFDNLTQLKTLLVDNGWTWLTAVCTMLFSLMHWPCSTTCLTIRKETQSWKWTVVSILIPTIIGMTVCFLVASAARLMGLV